MISGSIDLSIRNDMQLENFRNFEFEAFCRGFCRRSGENRSMTCCVLKIVLVLSGAVLVIVIEKESGDHV